MIDTAARIPTITPLVHPDVLDYVKNRFGYSEHDLIIDSLEPIVPEAA
ncbi:hypothetical protein ACEXQD_06000 [Herbiconiux sp. P15]